VILVLVQNAARPEVNFLAKPGYLSSISEMTSNGNIASSNDHKIVWMMRFYKKVPANSFFLLF